jgi:hypothetical protein
MLFNKKEGAKEVAVAPVAKAQKKAKCKFHKAHDRHCVDCNK